MATSVGSTAGRTIGSTAPAVTCSAESFDLRAKYSVAHEQQCERKQQQEAVDTISLTMGEKRRLHAEEGRSQTTRKFM